MAKDLAGQDVVFNVVLHDIKKRVIPELTEEFFKDLDMEGVSNKEELEKLIEEELTVQKEHQVENKFIEDLLAKASDNMTIELDVEIIEAERDRMYNDFVQKLSMQGINEELYYTYSGAKKEDVLNDMSKEAEVRLKYRYLLGAIVKEEKIEVTDEEAKHELSHMAEHYHMTEEELMNEIGSLEVIKFDIRMQKALEVLKENN